MFIVFVVTEAIEWSHPFLLSVIQIYIFISHSGRFGRIIFILFDRVVVPPVKALFYVHIFFSGGHQLCSLLCSILSASCTTFAVWMTKKMYRISVNFVRALTRFRS